MVRLRVLGPIEATVNDDSVDLGGPRQRAVLALLLTRRGDVIAVDQLIHQLWRGEPPRKATASLQAYVSNLRRLLEPHRPPRAPAELLVSVPPGYALRLGGEAVDAWRFEAALADARTAEPEAAWKLLTEALGWWTGTAYAEVADEEWAVAEVARLGELRLSARELVAEAGLRTGRLSEAVAAAEALTHDEPLREEGWRLLALGLWGTGRQADALAALRRSRTILGDELGLDPGPGLAELETAILGHRTETLNAVITSRPSPAAAAPRVAGEPHAGDPFVGREAELATLSDAAVQAHRGGRTVLVTGEAGAGKSRLLGEVARRLAEQGWIVLTGRCPEFDGAPAAWAWVEILRDLAAYSPPAEVDAVAPMLGDTPAEGDGDDATTGRFRLHQAVCRWLRTASEDHRFAIMIDDLHRADAETLLLLEGVAALGAPLLTVLAYRPDDAEPQLATTLGTLARQMPHRVSLGGLGLPAIRALVSSLHPGPVDDEIVSALAERTGGNPFYLRESARLLAGEGALVALSEVPQGVRDVVRRRLDRLPRSAVTVLRLASVAGRETETDVLVEAGQTGVEEVLDGLEAALLAGLLTEPEPGRVRFAHAIVRETLYTDLPRLRRTRMHARLAGTLRHLRPDDLNGLAYHYGQAGTADAVPLAVDYAIRAARASERRYAHDAAAGLLRAAVEAVTRHPTGVADPDAILVDLLARTVRAEVRAGAVRSARETRQRAVAIAERANRDDLYITALTAWTEPTPWQIRSYGSLDRATVAVLQRLLGRDDLDPATRCRLLDALVAELDGEDDPRIDAALDEQLAIARELGDPALLAAAITTKAKYRGHPAQQRQWADELRNLAARHDMPAYAWMCEHLDAMLAAAANDPDGMRRHAEAGLVIARRYRMAEPETAGLTLLAMLAHIGGRLDEAEERYAEVADRLRRHRALHTVPIRTLTLTTVRLSQGRMAEMEPDWRALFESPSFGPPAGGMLALVLARQGRLTEAAEIPLETMPRPDFLYSLNIAIRAELAVLLGRRDLAPELIRRLEPLRDQLAGVTNGGVTMGPIAHSLGELHRLLGDEAQAVRQFQHAERIAERWGSRHWAQRARTARVATPAVQHRAVLHRRELRGRERELEALYALRSRALNGNGGALVVRGEAGIGKTTLIDRVAASANGMRVLRATGVEFEVAFPYAGLLTLVAPLDDVHERLPAPQRQALDVAAGRRQGARPDAAMVGMATLTLLSEAAQDRPVLGVVDDAQWLDDASARALAFAARRLAAEPVLLLFGVREPAPTGDLAALPSLRLGRLADGDARLLLADALHAPLDQQVAGRVLAESGGNPLTLLELARGTGSQALAGGFGGPAPGGASEHLFHAELAALPPQTRRLLLVAAADPLGDPVLLWSAARGLGIPADAASPAEDAELVRIDLRVRFRHPLVRSAVYQSASPSERRAAHRALAEVTDPEADPDRHAWHRALATTGIDGNLAAELVRSAERVRTRGGLAAAATFLEHAARLTPDAGQRRDRVLAAAADRLEAGAPAGAVALLAEADLTGADAATLARVELLRGRAAFAQRRGRDAVAPLRRAAELLEPVDPALARAVHLDALLAAVVTGALGGASIGEAARVARSAVPSGAAPTTVDLLLDGLALVLDGNRRDGSGLLRRALAQSRDEDWEGRIALGGTIAWELWDPDVHERILERQIERMRAIGNVTRLPEALATLAAPYLRQGRFDEAAAVLEQARELAAATGTAPGYSHLTLAAWTGDPRTGELVDAAAADAEARGEGLFVAYANFALALYLNGRGDYVAALSAATYADSHLDLAFRGLGLRELIEAAVRSGDRAAAEQGYAVLRESAAAAGTDFATGAEACCAALLLTGDDAELQYRAALDALGRGGYRADHARAQLLYGEWLRREGRRSDARRELRAAHAALTAMGADGFARRAARELSATGQRARTRTVESESRLTAQELTIARLVAAGATSKEVSAELFLSPRTVDAHLRNIFRKLDITSRRQLRDVPLHGRRS